MVHKDGGTARTDGIVGLPAQVRHRLSEALEEMDSFLRAEEVEPALTHLVSMLRHLQAVRRLKG